MNSLVVLEDNKYIGTASLCETILCRTAEAVPRPVRDMRYWVPCGYTL